MDQYKVEIAKQALKEFKHIDKQYHQKLYDSIFSLEGNAFPSNSLKLVNTDFYRIRVGDYRIVYFVSEKENKITVTRVRHRKDVY